MTKQRDVTARRAARIRRSVKAAANGRARLSVHRSSKQIYAQVIDDAKGETLVAASTMEKALRSEIKSGATVAAAAAVGKAIADRAKAKGITRIVFDRGGYMYHGRVKALAEAAREGGLEF
jgi:large subunit ribosomal protein L18